MPQGRRMLRYGASRLRRIRPGRTGRFRARSGAPIRLGKCVGTARPIERQHAPARASASRCHDACMRLVARPAARPRPCARRTCPPGLSWRPRSRRCALSPGERRALPGSGARRRSGARGCPGAPLSPAQTRILFRRVTYTVVHRKTLPPNADSKLLDVTLAFAVARRWPHVRSNAVEPGWVATKMGGPGAPDDLELAPVTQVWLAVSDDPSAAVTGRYFYHQRPRETHPAASDAHFQEALLEECQRLTGVALPDRKSTRLNSSHLSVSRMPSSA